MRENTKRENKVAANQVFLKCWNFFLPCVSRYGATLFTSSVVETYGDVGRCYHVAIIAKGGYVSRVGGKR
jgi:hypothetical protein